jgi:hypothetical protein
LFAAKISNNNSSRGNPSFLSSSPKAITTSVSYTPAFPAEPSLLCGGSTNFSDLSCSHREQQQLFLLNHGCRHPSLALARTKPEDRERERERENKRLEGKTEQRKQNRGKTKVVCSKVA